MAIDPTTPSTPTSMLFAWLASQGTSTVLLVAMFAFLFVQIPKLTERIESGYTRNAEQLQDAMNTQNATIERMLTIIEARSRQQELQADRIEKAFSHQQLP